MKTKEQIVEKLKDIKLTYAELTNSKIQSLIDLLKKEEELENKLFEEAEELFGEDEAEEMFDLFIMLDVFDNPTVKKNNDLLDELGNYI